MEELENKRKLKWSRVGSPTQEIFWKLLVQNNDYVSAFQLFEKGISVNCAFAVFELVKHVREY